MAYSVLAVDRDKEAGPTAAESLAQISESLEQIRDSQSPGLVDAYLLPATGTLVATLVGAAIAFLFSKRLWRLQVERSESIESAKLLLEFAMEIEEVAVNYWLLDKTASNEADCASMELKIGSTLMVANMSVSRLAERQTNDELEAVRTLFAELFDCATGGPFRSSRRAACPKTAAVVSRTCAKLRLSLIKISHRGE